MKRKVEKEIKKIKGEFLKTVTMLIVSAFGFVAALAWNTAITQTIERYLKPGQGIWSWFIYAILVTIFAVLITIYLGRLAENFKEDRKED